MAISVLEEVERGRGREGLVAMLQTHTIPPAPSFPLPLHPSSLPRAQGPGAE